MEFNEQAVQTLLLNRETFFPSLREDAIARDIVELDYERLLDASGCCVGEVDLVHGGPPCTPFSKSGYWLAYKRAGEDPKASLLDNFVEALVQTRPKAFIMENVFALGYRNHNRAVLDRFIRGVREAGYSFDREVLIAADFGAPQLRQRLICVGVRSDILDCGAADYRFPWPKVTHAGPHETRKQIASDLPDHVTTGEALAGLNEFTNPPEPEEVVKGTFAEEFREVPPGDNYLFLTAKRGHPDPKFEWRKRYWSFLLKLSPSKPSPTIQGQPGPWVGPFHWDNRRLRVGELKRLMTFPDDFVVAGSRRDQQLQLGNAVPPLLGETVARCIASELGRLQTEPALVSVG